MLNAYERHLALVYVGNMLRRLNRKRSEGRNLLERLEENAPIIGLDARSTVRLRRAASAAAASVKSWQALRKFVDLASAKAGNTPPDQMGRRLRHLGDRVGLSSLDVALLEVLLHYKTQPVIEGLIDAAFLHSRMSPGPMNIRGEALPCVLGKSTEAVRSRFAQNAPLVRSGLVSIEEDQDVHAIGRLCRFGSPGPEETDVRLALLGESRTSELTWSDFDHLGQNRDDVARLFHGSVTRGARGVNVLVYGPPGTGKTEFCRVLANRLELDRLNSLTPGDFEVVRRKAEVLGTLDDVAALLDMLRAECDAKPDRTSSIGFVAA